MFYIIFNQFNCQKNETTKCTIEDNVEGCEVGKNKISTFKLFLVLRFVIQYFKMMAAAPKKSGTIGEIDKVNRN
jgi:hypothetical protein